MTDSIRLDPFSRLFALGFKPNHVNESRLPNGSQIQPTANKGHGSAMSAPKQQPENQVAGSKFEHWVVPNDQATIQSISALIYPLFSIDAKIAERCSIRMAGCTIEEWPILELASTSLNDGPDPASHFISERGQMDAATVQTLRLLDSVRLEREPDWFRSPSRREQLDQLVKSVIANPDERSNDERTRVIWCQHVDGKLHIELDKTVREIKFSGWSSQFSNGRSVCPPFLCQASGKSGYRLTADDEGDLTVPAALQTCASSGQELIQTKMSRCAVSDQWVEDSLLWTCPSSGDRIVESLASACEQCGQAFSPASNDGTLCHVCEKMSTKSGAFPEFVNQAVDSIPELASVKKWKWGSCEEYSVAIGHKLWSRFLVVWKHSINKPIRICQANRFGKTWRRIDVSE